LGTTLYGTTVHGGISDFGTVFKINTDGSGFAALNQFKGLAYNFDTKGDGANPGAGLVLDGTMLYGTTIGGGSYGQKGGGNTGYGTIFQINTDGTDYAVLKRFTNSDGAAPYAELVFSNNVLYGTTGYGGILDAPNGDWGSGVVFSLSIAPPTISVPPQNQTAEIGSTVVFTMGVAGDPVLAYELFSNGTNLISCSTNCEPESQPSHKELTVG
jgi:uncharacterized repeat protein (TIGR03803 family)